MTDEVTRIDGNDQCFRLYDQGFRLNDQGFRHNDQGFRHNDQGFRHNDQDLRHNDQGFCHNDQCFRHDYQGFRHNGPFLRPIFSRLLLLMTRKAGTDFAHFMDDHRRTGKVMIKSQN